MTWRPSACSKEAIRRGDHVELINLVVVSQYPVWPWRDSGASFPAQILPPKNLFSFGPRMVLGWQLDRWSKEDADTGRTETATRRKVIYWTILDEREELKGTAQGGCSDGPEQKAKSQIKVGRKHKRKKAGNQQGGGQFRRWSEETGRYLWKWEMIQTEFTTLGRNPALQEPYLAWERKGQWREGWKLPRELHACACCLRRRLD